jgi:hypothetical protein
MSPVVWNGLEPVFRWAYQSWLGSAIRNSTWAFAYIEVFHLLGLTLLLGCVVVLSLRLAGLVMPSLPTAELAREIQPYLLSGLALAVISGAMMFAAESDRCFASTPFQYKMMFLALAVIFQFGAFARLIRTERAHPLLDKLAAAISLALWFAVGWSGRAIAFFN